MTDETKRVEPPEGAITGPTSAERREQARDLLTRAPRLRKRKKKDQEIRPGDGPDGGANER